MLSGTWARNTVFWPQGRHSLPLHIPQSAITMNLLLQTPVHALVGLMIVVIMPSLFMLRQLSFASNVCYTWVLAKLLILALLSLSIMMLFGSSVRGLVLSRSTLPVSVSFASMYSQHMNCQLSSLRQHSP